ncbi:MAG: hypothetical protein WCG05_01640 [Alphaproteobacteria bacterium]
MAKIFILNPKGAKKTPQRFYEIPHKNKPIKQKISVRKQLNHWLPAIGVVLGLSLCSLSLLLYYWEQQETIVLPDLKLPETLYVSDTKRPKPFVNPQDDLSVPFIKVEDAEDLHKD